MPDEADISPGKPPLGDLLLERFFLKAGSAHEFEASVEMDADVNLVGRIGMLEMTATGDDEANPHGDQFDASGTLTIDLTPMVRRTRRRAPGGGHRSKWLRNAPVAAS